MQSFIKRKRLNICEFFISHQGEGRLIGELMYFIRLGGCNLSCSWCDTNYAKNDFKEISIPDIIKKVIADGWNNGRWICITGGEPLMQEETGFLIDQLLKEDYKIILETNGSYPIDSLNSFKKIMISMDIKCPSSGEERRNLFSNIHLLEEKDQLKFVIDSEEDYLYAVDIINRYKPGCVCIFQPQLGSNDPKKFGWLFDRCKADLLNVRVILQQHKIIYGDVRGV